MLPTFNGKTWDYKTFPSKETLHSFLTQRSPSSVATIDQIEKENRFWFSEGDMQCMDFDSTAGDRAAKAVSSWEVVDRLHDLGFLPAIVNEGKGKYNHLNKHTLRFRKWGSDSRPEVGGYFLEVVLHNGNNGRQHFELQSGLYVLVCSNGMVVSHQIGVSIKIQHREYTHEVMEDAVERLVKQLPDMTAKFELLSGVTLKSDQKQEIIREAINIRFSPRKVRLDEEIEKLQSETPTSIQRKSIEYLRKLREGKDGKVVKTVPYSKLLLAPHNDLTQTYDTAQKAYFSDQHTDNAFNFANNVERNLRQKGRLSLPVFGTNDHKVLQYECKDDLLVSKFQEKIFDRTCEIVGV